MAANCSRAYHRRQFFMQLRARIWLAPFHFLVARPFKLGLGDHEGIRADAGERIEHTECSLDIGHYSPPLAKLAFALLGAGQSRKESADDSDAVSDMQAVHEFDLLIALICPRRASRG